MNIDICLMNILLRIPLLVKSKDRVSSLLLVFGCNKVFSCCPCCSFINGRDLNASKNIFMKGIPTSASYPTQAERKAFLPITLLHHTVSKAQIFLHVPYELQYTEA